MFLLLTLIVIWAGYKFFTQWIWWIIGIMLLIDVWKIVTSWPALLIIAGTCFYLLYKRHKENMPRKKVKPTLSGPINMQGKKY
ncbi:hypothetical protein EFR94_12560 [Levilactobacillus brevis]|nr:hypothetical protein [Levilactobacillus brevis]MCT3568188.1 hypothetical protein [Levilactobacillus brevis]RDF81084.1 hypothetical protein DQM16_12145 [Levilactobacillus brevis]STX22928.1 Uncharacterised protein [Levilactobacillus brevis]